MTTVLVDPGRLSGEEVPPDALSWRTNNPTLDLTTEEAERRLPPGSALAGSSSGEDGSTGETSYPAERRTA